VFHHHQGVPEFGEAFHDPDETVIVSGVKTDARLVQDIEGVDQGGAEGRSQGNALDLTPGKGAGLPVQGDIAQAHVSKVSESARDLTQDKSAGFIPGRDMKGLKKRVSLIHVQGIDFTDIQPPKAIQKGLFLEPGPMAFRADGIATVPGKKDPHVHLIGPGFKPSEKPPDPIIAGSSFHQGLLLGLCQVLEWGVCGDLLSPTKGHHVVKLHAVVLPVSPRLDGPFLQGKGEVRYNEIQVHINGPAKAPAVFAGPNRAVKGEEVGQGEPVR
jgi:hypothetical protein